MEQNGQYLEAALRYAELGYPVFPCAPGGKVPLTKRGFKDASTDPRKIRAWWTGRPDANVGIPTEGLLVLDIDGPDNGWCRDDPDRLMELACGPISLTPRGGRHHVYRQPEGKAWKNTSGRLGPMVDTRASGGYIVVPPSCVGRKPYQWAEGYELTDPPDGLPEPPAWLSDLLDRTVASHEAPRSPTFDSPPVVGNVIPEGQRNATLARLGGVMRRVGMGFSEIRAALLQTNADRCHPPLPPPEVDRTAASICRYEPDQVSVAVIENHWAQDQGAPAEEPAPTVEDPGPLPEDLLRVPGFVSEVMDYSLETAPYPNTVMAFCGALALQAFLAGRKVRDPGGVRTNIYLLGLAHSAAGKDWPRKVNLRVAAAAGLDSCLGDRFASGEGVQDLLYHRPCMLFQTDEIDGMLLSINRSREARHENLMSTLLTMYSSSDSIYAMRAKAGKETLGVIDQPCLVVFGTAIPNHYYEALSERMLTNGFFARMLILEGGKRSQGQEALVRDLPDRVVETAKWWAAFHPGGGNLDKWHPEPRVVEETEKARGLQAESRRAADEEYAAAEERGDPVMTTVWGRVREQTRKLALLYAVSENHEEPVIGAEAVRWATRFVRHQTQRMLFMAFGHVAENPFHAECLKVLEKLRGAPGGTLPHSVLLKRMKVDSKAFGSIIETLVQQGDIEMDSVLTAGRTGRIYRLRRGEKS